MQLRFSISLKILTMILPLICLPIAIVGYFSFQASVARVDRLVRHEQMVQVKATAEGINDIFYYCRLDLQTIARLSLMEDYYNAREFRLYTEAEFHHDSIVRLFRDFIGRTDYYFQIRYIDRNGQELIKVRRNQTVGNLSDQSAQPFFLETRNAGKDDILVSEIVTSAPDGDHVIYWSKAIFSGLGEFAGIVVIDLDYNKILRKVNSITVEEKGYAFLVDGSGRLIAHPRFELFHFDLGSYPTQNLRETVQDMMTGDTGWRIYTFESEEKVAAFAPIPMMNWSLAVTVPVAVLKKDALAIRAQVIKAVLITLVFAMAGVMALTYFLLKPVRTLVDATKQIAGGDLSHEIPVQSSDELGDLTRAFNQMVRNLAHIQNELVRSEKLISLGKISAGVAHEIRNPLNAMKGAIVYLQRRRADDPLVKEYTGLIFEEIDRLNMFVTDFLHFARQSRPKPAPVNINRLILYSQQLFEERARQGNIRFHNRLEEELPEMLLDAHQIEQVLVNIIINAMDALPDGGDISFTTRMFKKSGFPDAVPWFRLTVQDNGSGIQADFLQNIFDPFFSTKEGGTGLGLPLTLGIVENHQGQIHVDSQVGIGTSVIIEWPLNRQI
ncbi:MAG: cache domain-containing protein [Pseudomonadota bacterium]